MTKSNNKKNKKLNKFNNINKRLIVLVLLLIFVIVSGTYAWYTYSSRKSALVLTIGDLPDAKVVLKPYQINGTIEPVNSYTDGEYTQIEVNTSSNIEMSLYYKINELSEELINNGLKYTIVQSDSKDGTYTSVKTGDFKSVLDNKLDVLIVELSSNTYYRIYIWVDSSIGNQTDFQNTNINVELNGTLASK